MNAVRIAANLICFGLGLASLGAAINAFEPLPKTEQIGEKLEAYRRGGGHYDCVFFGSSKINHGFIPPLFDEELRRRGRTLTSFNFGIGGMGFPESKYLCENLLRQFSPPRYVFVEAAAVRWYIPGRHMRTRRVQYWHDLECTLLVLRALFSDTRQGRIYGLDADPSGLRPAGLVREHLVLFAKRSTRAGEGAEHCRTVLGEPSAAAQDSAEPAAPAAPEMRGYVPLTRTISGKALAAYEENLRHFDAGTPAPGEPFWDEAYLDLQRSVARAGAKLILVVFPNHIPVRPLFTHVRDSAPPIWSFDGPTRYPELYHRVNRESNVHLNERGAPIFTRLFAERFDQWLAAEAKTP